MKASTQPTRSYPRYRKLTVGDILEALKDMPKDARVRCKDGPIQAHEDSPYLAPTHNPERNTVETCWL